MDVSLILDPRIKIGIQKVHDQVDDHIHHGHKKDTPLHHGIIPAVDGGHHILPQPR
jgi:hypothetical protein